MRNAVVKGKLVGLAPKDEGDGEGQVERLRWTARDGEAWARLGTEGPKQR